VPEAVADGVSGILVDPEDPVQIKDAILLLLSDEEYANKLGENGLKRVKEHFTWDKQAEILAKFV